MIAQADKDYKGEHVEKREKKVKNIIVWQL